MATDDSHGSASVQSAVAASLIEHWRLFLIEGIVLLLLGIVAILIPARRDHRGGDLIGWVLLVERYRRLDQHISYARSAGLRVVAAVGGGRHRGGRRVARVAVVGRALAHVDLDGIPVLEGIASIMMALQHRHGFSARWAMLW